jgi:hypothetical protein
MSTSRNYIFIMGFMAAFTAFFCFEIASANTCDQWVARAVSVQGGVQVLKEGERQWQPVKLHDLLCPGDMVRVLKLGRADILMRNESVLRLDQHTTVRFSRPESEKSLLLNLLRGAVYFFSRLRRGRVILPLSCHKRTEFFVSVEAIRPSVRIEERWSDTRPTFFSEGNPPLRKRIAPAVRIVATSDAVQWALIAADPLYQR